MLSSQIFRSSPVRIFTLFLIVLVIQSQIARASWLGDLCARALGRPSVNPNAEEVHRVEVSLTSEIHRSNIYSSQHFELSEVDHFDQIQGRPATAIAELALSSSYEWIVPVSVTVFANPLHVKDDWNDHGSNLGKVPALLVLFEDVRLKNSQGKKALLSEVMKDEALRIQKHAPDVNVKLNFVPVGEFKELEFTARAQGKTLMWAEGSIENFQLKRITLLSAQYAFEQVAHDPRFAILKHEHAPK